MRVWISLLTATIAGTAAACSSAQVPSASSNETIAFIRPLPGPQGHTALVFVPGSHAEDAPAIFEGERPRHFPWVSVTLPTAMTQLLVPREARLLDLKSASSDVVFSQVYLGVCNPALENYDPCLLYESYRSGEAGLSGFVQVDVSDKRATAIVEVAWEGITDRFGAPLQLHQHGTTGNFSADIYAGDGAE